MEEFIKFAPLIIVVLVFMYQNHIFVKPEELEKKHREILKDAEDKYVTWVAHKELKHSVEEMKDKIDKIFEFLISKEDK